MLSGFPYIAAAELLDAFDVAVAAEDVAIDHDAYFGAQIVEERGVQLWVNVWSFSSSILNERPCASEGIRVACDDFSKFFSR